MQAVRSQSSAGLTVVYVEFDWETDIYAARQMVQERLTTVAGALPEGIRPQMAPISSIMGQIMHVGMYRRRGRRAASFPGGPIRTWLAERAGKKRQNRS